MQLPIDLLLSEVTACGGQLPRSQTPHKGHRLLPQRYFNVVDLAKKEVKQGGFDLIRFISTFKRC